MSACAMGNGRVACAVYLGVGAHSVQHFLCGQPKRPHPIIHDWMRPLQTQHFAINGLFRQGNSSVCRHVKDGEACAVPLFQSDEYVLA